jgi:uncharacterized protein (DUF4415 family)
MNRWDNFYMNSLNVPGKGWFQDFLNEVLRGGKKHQLDFEIF